MCDRRKKADEELQLRLMEVTQDPAYGKREPVVHTGMMTGVEEELNEEPYTREKTGKSSLH